MNPKEYFENNKDKIYRTAEFLSGKEEKDVGDVFESLKNEFYNSDGSGDGEFFCLKNKKIVITEIIKGIRFLDHEQMLVVLISGEKHGLLCSWDGNQFSSNVDLNEMQQRIMSFKINNICTQEIYLYVVHNHPYKYRAVPSPEDFTVLKQMLLLIKSINYLDSLCKTTLIDFAVVTAFDYWSYQQNSD